MNNAISLYELNNVVRRVLSSNFEDRVWIRAELSDVRVNQNGHCYLEFIERDSNNKNIIAKARGSIWSNVFRLLKAYFESETGQSFSSGIKVLVEVSIEFHELYGYSLNVHSIDPTYTLGDQAKNRALILKQLEEEGVLYLNKELSLASVPNRIAIISSPTAAGYEDFCNQLKNNPEGFIFYTHLFPAIMQGERTEASIIEALEKIYEYIDRFDAVVIIRGGGAASDLNAFDSYILAANCAQFPIPIITGIGHERDETVLDFVAHTRAKTPTAVAEFLIDEMLKSATKLFNIYDALIKRCTSIMSDERARLSNVVTRFSYLTKHRSADQLNKLNLIKDKLNNLVKGAIDKERNRLASYDQYLKLSSPETILKKGYSLTLKDNKIVKTAHDLKEGDIITTRFIDGEKVAQVKK